MFGEAMEYLDLKPGKIVVDATAGTGGHSLGIIERILPGGRLIAIDRDKESLEVASERLENFKPSCEFIHANFTELDEILKRLNVEKIDGILFDLGVSTFQVLNPQRGFSFQYDGPLDMRLDRSSYISAYDLVNNLNEDEISNILWTLGQERWHNRIAHLLVQERQKHPISTTSELSNIVMRAIPYKYRNYRIHPATRTFQAVRIAVNRELQALEGALHKAIGLLNKGGRICVISFHSLEDRIVKLAFREFAAKGQVNILTDKPLTPGFAEVRDNPPSRSAKLRAAQKIK